VVGVVSTAVTGFVHPALFYRDEAEYVGVTVPFIRGGLAAGEPVAVAVPRPRLEMLADALGPDAARTTMIDMSQAGRNPGRIIPSVLRAFADQFPRHRTRIVSEPIWAGRSPTEYPACVQHEALVNFAFAGRTVTKLCPYDVSVLDEAVVADARTTHPVLVDGDASWESPDYDPDLGVRAGNVPLPTRPPSTEVLFSADTVRAARAYAVAWSRRAGLLERRVLDVELIVSELGSNCVTHGGGRGSLWVFLDDGYLVCELANAGIISDPLAGRSPVSPDESRGRGLLLVNQLADLVRVHTTAETTTVRAYLALD
jgi:anti-sigma regulatory factor (Ser/Thr protein kinase)